MSQARLKLLTGFIYAASFLLITSSAYEVLDGDADIAPVPALAPSDDQRGNLSSFLMGFISSAQQPGLSDNTTAPLRVNYAASTMNALSPGTAPSLFMGPARPPSYGRRHLMQGGVNTISDRDIFWEANVQVTDANNKQTTYLVSLDTGSSEFLLPGDAGPSPFFDVTGLEKSGKSATIGYGGGSKYVGDFYPASFQFVGATGKAAVEAKTNILVGNHIEKDGSVRPNGGSKILGLSYAAKTVEQLVPGGKAPLINFLETAKFAYNAFTLFLHEVDPIPSSGLTADQGQLTFGNTLPDLVNLDQNINAPAIFQDVDLACYLATPRPNAGTNWVVPVSSLTSDPGPDPLGPNSINACQQGCLAIVDSGWWALGVPPNVLSQLLVALGLPGSVADSPSVSLGRAAKFPEISCDVRKRNTPSLDFAVKDRIYSMLPGDYIQVYNNKCYVIVAYTGGPNSLAFGSTFLAKYPGTFFTDISSNGVSAPLPGPRICFYGNVPVVAQCNPPIILPATSDCSAKISEIDLLAQVNGANKDVIFTSDPPSPDQTNFTLSPGSDAGGNYVLPLGDHTFTLTATNKLGSSTCTSLVTVVDQEPFTSDALACATPPDGVIKTNLIPTGSPTRYTPTVAKSNGCSVTATISDLSCKNCFLGPNIANLALCAATIEGNSVQITELQEGRVYWSITAENEISRADRSCAVCASRDGLDLCPTPFSVFSPCTPGNY